MNAARLLDAYDAADLLLLSARRVRLLAKQQKLPHVALPDGEIRFTEADLVAWINAHKRIVPPEVQC
jgi:hypothetical protein